MHMSPQLHCYNKCKIVKWLNNYLPHNNNDNDNNNNNNNNTYFCKIWIMIPQTFSEMHPWACHRSRRCLMLLTDELVQKNHHACYLTHWGRDKMDAISQTTFFKQIFLNENVWILIKFSLKFVPRGPISNIPALVQIMAWRRRGDKPLSEPEMV